MYTVVWTHSHHYWKGSFIGSCGNDVRTIIYAYDMIIAENIWIWLWRDSNHGPFACRANALPLSYTGSLPNCCVILYEWESVFTIHIVCKCEPLHRSPDEAQSAKETDTMHTEVVQSNQLVECVCVLCQAGCDHSRACSSRRGHHYSRKYMDLVVPGLELRAFRLPGECSTIELHRIATELLCNSVWVRERVHYTYCV